MRAFESNDDNVDNVDKRQDFVCILYHILERHQIGLVAWRPTLCRPAYAS